MVASSCGEYLTDTAVALSELHAAELPLSTMWLDSPPCTMRVLPPITAASGSAANIFLQMRNRLCGASSAAIMCTAIDADKVYGCLDAGV